jgi:opacity protein-like surface antigen
MRQGRQDRKGKGVIVTTTKTLGLAGASYLLSIMGAAAADMPQGYPMPPVVQPVPVETILSGWYARGDAAYRLNQLGSIDTELAPGAINKRIDDAFAVGLGFGYKWNWIRTDVTVDYGFDANYRSDSAAFAPDYSAKISTVTSLANLYFDLGTWFGITPYVGAGAGAAFVRMSDFASASYPGSPVSNDRWNFAWAAMGGLSYAFSPHLLVDIGYRYLDQGYAQSGVVAPAPSNQQVTIKDLTAHEVRAGVRYAF